MLRRSLTIAFLPVFLFCQTAVFGAGIDRIQVTDTNLTIFPAIGNPPTGHLVSMEFGDTYSGARGWTLTAGTGGVIGLTSNEVLRLTFVAPGGTFRPVLTNAEVINGTQVRCSGGRAEHHVACGWKLEHRARRSRNNRRLDEQPDARGDDWFRRRVH